jgi:hypothetical protein
MSRSSAPIAAEPQATPEVVARRTLRRKQNEESYQKLQTLVKEGLEKGILPEHLAPSATNKAADILQEFVLLETVSDGNCLPHAIVLGNKSSFAQGT